MHHYPFHVGDYQKDTAHFDQDPEKVEVPVGLVRDLAYRRLLDLYHSQEGPIPNKTHWVATRVRLLAHAAIVGSVLKEFFELRDGFWHQKRADAEVARYQKRVVTNQENGKKGGRKPTTIPTGNPVGSKPRTRTRTNTQGSANLVERAKRAAKRCPPEFEVTPDMVLWAFEKAPSLTTEALQRETEKFKDHTFARAITDWPATWRNWIRTATDGHPFNAKTQSSAQAVADRRASTIAGLTAGNTRGDSHETSGQRPDDIEVEARRVDGESD